VLRLQVDAPVGREFEFLVRPLEHSDPLAIIYMHELRADERPNLIVLGRPVRCTDHEIYAEPKRLLTRLANPNSQVIVMILKVSASLAFAAACLTAVVAMPANANTPSARQNVMHSDHYTRMLQTNRAFRQARMRKECGPVTDPELHQQCLASFQEYSPMVASAASHRKVASSRHHANQYVGSSAGPRHNQNHLGK
jgi:hypothetical protein